MPLHHQARKGIAVLGGVTDPYHHEETGLPLHHGGKKDYVWSAGDLSGYLLVQPCPVSKVDGKLQSNPGRVTKGTGPQE